MQHGRWRNIIVTRATESGAQWQCNMCNTARGVDGVEVAEGAEGAEGADGVECAEGLIGACGMHMSIYVSSATIHKTMLVLQLGDC